MDQMELMHEAFKAHERLDSDRFNDLSVKVEANTRDLQSIKEVLANFKGKIYAIGLVGIPVMSEVVHAVKGLLITSRPSGLILWLGRLF